MDEFSVVQFIKDFNPANLGLREMVIYELGMRDGIKEAGTLYTLTKETEILPKDPGAANGN